MFHFLGVRILTDSEYLCGQHVCKTVLLDIFQHDMFYIRTGPCFHQVRIPEILDQQLSLVHPYSHVLPTHQNSLWTT